MKTKTSFFEVWKRNLGAALHSSRLAVPLTLAMIVGGMTGLAVVGYVRGVNGALDFFRSLQGTFQHFFPRPVSFALVTAFGGVIVGLLTCLFIPESKAQGVPDVLQSLALKGGYLSFRATVVRALASVLSLGAGFSTGREGPAVHIGAGIGSKIGRTLGLNSVRVKNLVACGAAAGIAAVFNAPITAVMFCLEIIFRDFGAKALSTIVIASVSSSIVSRIFLGQSPAFTIPIHSLADPFEIPLYCLLGVLSAFSACAFIFVFDRVDRFFEKVKVPFWMKPAIGGLVVGGMAFYLPGISSMGFSTMESMLHGRLVLETLLAVLVVKALATSISMGSGCTGGTFAPALFIGGALGGAFGFAIQGHMPFPTGTPGAYALVGMASVFAGAFHAPVTAILLVFEMTGDYRMILPLMAATVIAAALSQKIQPEPIDTVKLKRQGIDVDSVDSTSFLSVLRVADAMSLRFEKFSNQMTAKEVLEKISQVQGKTFFSVNAQGTVTGILTPEIFEKVLVSGENMSHVIVEDLASPIYESCYPDDSLGDAVHLMKIQELDVLPVMSPEKHGIPIGVLKSEDVFRAVANLAVKREELFSRMEHHRDGKILTVRFRVSGRSPLAGKELRQLVIPEGVVLNMILRNGETIIPHGSTVFQPQDKITATVLLNHEAVFRKWLGEHKIYLSFKEQS